MLQRWWWWANGQTTGKRFVPKEEFTRQHVVSAVADANVPPDVIPPIVIPPKPTVVEIVVECRKLNIGNFLFVALLCKHHHTAPHC
jgi:hypothetical protein